MKAIGNIGFLLLVIGCCAMGSDSIIPALMVFAGLAMLSCVARKE